MGWVGSWLLGLDDTRAWFGVWHWVQPTWGRLRRRSLRWPQIMGVTGMAAAERSHTAHVAQRGACARVGSSGGQYCSCDVPNPRIPEYYSPADGGGGDDETPDDNPRTKNIRRFARLRRSWDEVGPKAVEMERDRSTPDQIWRASGTPWPRWIISWSTVGSS